jgi:hypothetical protein
MCIYNFFVVCPGYMSQYGQCNVGTNPLMALLV